MPDGREVSLYTIKNKNGLMASVTDLGAVWVRMIVPDKNGVMDDKERSALRFRRRSYRKPHRKRKIFPERDRIHTGDQ